MQNRKAKIKKLGIVKIYHTKVMKDNLVKVRVEKRHMFLCLHINLLISAT